MTSPLQQAAQSLETAYLTQMLASAGFDRVLPGDSGHFSQFLLEAQAEAMVARGGIGLSQQIFELLSAKDTA